MFGVAPVRSQGGMYRERSEGSSCAYAESAASSTGSLAGHRYSDSAKWSESIAESGEHRSGDLLGGISCPFSESGPWSDSVAESAAPLGTYAFCPYEARYIATAGNMQIEFWYISIWPFLNIGWGFLSGFIIYVLPEF